jgi:hypothetical protein
VRLEGLGQLKNPMTSGIELAAFRFIGLVPEATTLPRALTSRMSDEWVVFGRKLLWSYRGTSPAFAWRD